MSKKSKRTSAPAPMEIPRPVVQPVGAPGTQPVQPASIPSMFGPGMWCPPCPLQCLPPSSAPFWFGGGIQQPGMAGSSAQQPGMAGSSTQGAWWTPAVAGIGGSRHSWPTADSQEDSDVLVWGLDSHPPGGFVNMLKSTPQVASNRTASQAIHIDSDNNDADHSRSEKRLTWTKEEDLNWKAKELRKKKKKDQPSIIDIEDELHSFLDAQKATNEGHIEMLETQRRVSSEKLESRRLAHLAAKENKEAVMLETYRSLLTHDTTGMDEDVKAEHVLALRCLRESLFKKND
ncbi:unnamed protein product [Miscanthus lutarioriparius]|uniref:No apical meristem-associated C-terminal domain-containing protein n=1 Tax=Miscanthus lutarioriparius TaxID=422564 RepID=A0A811NKB7_9POAL|nr:unnamed protein product [Miscanthus lutarioriparius]